MIPLHHGVNDLLSVGSYALTLGALLGLPITAAAVLIDSRGRTFWLDTLYVLGGYAALVVCLGIALLWTP